MVLAATDPWRKNPGGRFSRSRFFRQTPASMVRCHERSRTGGGRFRPMMGGFSNNLVMLRPGPRWAQNSPGGRSSPRSGGDELGLERGTAKEAGFSRCARASNGNERQAIHRPPDVKCYLGSSCLGPSAAKKTPASNPAARNLVPQSRTEVTTERAITKSPFHLKHGPQPALLSLLASGWFAGLSPVMCRPARHGAPHPIGHRAPFKIRRISSPNEGWSRNGRAKPGLLEAGSGPFISTPSNGTS